MPRKPSFPVGVFALAALFLPSGCERSAGEPSRVWAVPVARIEGIGYVEPMGEMRRLAFKRAGIVADCPVAVGRTVRRGEVLLRLRDESERAVVAEAEIMCVLADRM